jgi:uncharacterized protein (UPF0335 family)
MTIGAESIQNAIAAIVQDWLNAHPVLGWCATHPIWAIALLFLFIFSAWGLLGAIAQLVKMLWIELLRTPLRFGRWLGVRLLNFFRHPINENFQASDAQALLLQETQFSQPNLNESDLAAPQNGQTAQLSEVVARLEQLQKEQTQLLQEVRAILCQTSGDPLQSRFPIIKVSKSEKKLP